MNRIKYLRNAQTPKMSQEKLGQLVGVGRTTVAMWEGGRSEPDNTTLIKLAEIFDVSADYLLGRTDQKEKPPTGGRELKAPEGYEKLTSANRMIVDRLIADLAKSQSSD